MPQPGCAQQGFSFLSYSEQPTSCPCALERVIRRSSTKEGITKDFININDLTIIVVSLAVLEIVE